MKLLLLKILLQRRARDEGFTLPMVIALGLVMLLLGTANIVKSSEENLNAMVQNSSSDALAIAEVGITKYRELLNQNRILTIYNHNQWTSNNVNGVDVAGLTCANTTSAPPGWTGTATKPNDTAADDNWWNVSEDLDGNGTNELIGRYRLVSYEYDIDGLSIAEDTDDDGTPDDTTPNNENGVFSMVSDANTDDDDSTKPNYQSITNENDTDDDGESDAVGILTVQGQSTDGSEAQIQVEIPLRINQEDMPNLAPVLWIGSQDSTYTSSFAGNVGTITIPNDSNIVRVVAGCSDPADIGTNSVVSDARGIPPITSIANKITEAESAGSINTALPTGTLELGNTLDDPYVTPPSGATFNASTHCSNISDCRYYYKLGATTISSDIETDGISKVTLYVDGNLTINEDILGSSVSSNYLEVYVTSAGNITIDSNSVNTINAFIHAPDSTLTVNGTGTVNITGSVWVDKFVNNATVNFGVPETAGGVTTYRTETTKITSQNSVPTYTVYTTADNRTARPLTSSPTNWVKEEVE